MIFVAISCKTGSQATTSFEQLTVSQSHSKQADYTSLATGMAEILGRRNRGATDWNDWNLFHGRFLRCS